MTFDLAVWEGDRPTTDAAASAIYEALMDRIETEFDAGVPATVRIQAFVDDLLARWPDIDQPDSEDSPWADSPLIANAVGNAIYFAMVWTKADEAAAFVTQVALKHRLVCFDPQSETLLPPAGDHATEISRPGGRSWFRDRKRSR